MVVALAFLAGLACHDRSGLEPAEANREHVLPGANLLLVVVDTLRADHLGGYGYSKDTSPFVDELGRKGVVSERAMSQSSWTKGAMGSLFTGTYPHRHQAMFRTDALSPDSVTLAERLRAEGYRTVAVQTNPFLTRKFGFDQGFGRFVYRHDARAETVASLLLDELSFASGPFFGYVHFMDPHLPYRPPREYVDRFTSGYEGDLDQVEFGGRVPELRKRSRGYSDEDKEHVVGLYDGEIRYVDDQLRSLFGELERRGLLEDTLVIVTSDHGEELWDHDRFEHGHTMFNELLRVPLIAIHPRGLGSGTRRDEVIRLVDLYPTILGTLDLEAPDEAVGEDLGGVWFGSQDAPELTAFAEATLYGPELKALQTGEAKLVFDVRRGARRLYRLEGVWEIAAADPDLEEQLLNELLHLAYGDPGVARQQPVTLDRESVEQLEALGYAN